MLDIGYGDAKQNLRGQAMADTVKLTSKSGEPEGEPGGQVLAKADDNFRAAFAAARGTVSPDLDLNPDADQTCCHGRLSSG